MFGSHPILEALSRHVRAVKSIIPSFHILSRHWSRDITLDPSPALSLSTLSMEGTSKNLALLTDPMQPLAQRPLSMQTLRTRLLSSPLVSRPYVHPFAQLPLS